MSHPTLSSSKHCKVFLLGASTLVCLALSTPAMATDFVITRDDGSTNGFGTEDGAPAADIADGAINGDDTVSLGIAIATGTNIGIETHHANIGDGGNTITVLDTGSITTTGDSTYGIYNDGDDNETTVSGGITTAGDYAYGIYNDGDINDAGDSETTVSGGITTGGDYAYGIINVGDTNKTTISGSITTTGDSAHAIYNVGDTNKTTVSGSIVTEGSQAHGIFNYGDNNYTWVYGSITTTGAASYGIGHDGSFNATYISGTVKATDPNTAVLYSGNGDGNSFTLNEGATIIGDVLAKDDATNSKLIFNLGSSTSYAYSVSGKGAGIGLGQWAFSDQDGRTQGVTTTGTGCAPIADAGNDTCNLVTAVGNGNAETQNELQFGTNTSMIGSLSLGGNTGGSAEAKSVAQTSKMDVWTQVYSGSLERDARTKQTSFDADYLGLTLGTPVSFKDDTLNLDLVFNMSTTELDISPTQDQEITAKSYNLGAVFRDLAPSTGLVVDAYGFMGHNSYDAKRKVMNNQQATGSETVTASYSGMEVLVGADAQYSQAIDETLSFIGGVSASLSHEKIGSYSESKYFAWGSRTMTQLTGGVAAGLEYEKDALTGFATLGVQRSHLTHGKSASYTNNGAAGSNTDTSGAATYRTATAGFDYAVDDNMNIIGTAGMSRASDGIKGSSVSLSANWQF
jgi:hypothetical protein